MADQPRHRKTDHQRHRNVTMAMRRHHEERPFAKFTDQELWALDRLIHCSQIFAEDIATALDEWAELVTRELLEREGGPT